MDPSLDLVRRFVEYLAGVAAREELEERRDRPSLVDWEIIRTAIVGSQSIERALGRAVVVVHQMSQVTLNATKIVDTPSKAEREYQHPFFSFSVSNAVPDFGDQSRYRSKVARRMGRVFRSAE
jgi:hypothetical protein